MKYQNNYEFKPIFNNKNGFNRCNCPWCDFPAYSPSQNNCNCGCRFNTPNNCFPNNNWCNNEQECNCNQPNNSCREKNYMPFCPPCNNDIPPLKCDNQNLRYFLIGYLFGTWHE